MQKWFYVNCVVSIGIWFIQFRYWSHIVWWFPFFRQLVFRFVYNKKVPIILTVFLPSDVIIFIRKTWWECLLNCSFEKCHRKILMHEFHINFETKYYQVCGWIELEDLFSFTFVCVFAFVSVCAWTFELLERRTSF